MSKEDDTIPLETAELWTANWRAAHPNAPHAFIIPLKDLKGALAEIENQDGTPHARAYLAIDENNMEKLVIVGTTQDNSAPVTIYEDILPPSSPAGDDGDPNAKIWDFTKPCPPRCDNNSPLNGPVE